MKKQYIDIKTLKRIRLMYLDLMKKRDLTEEENHKFKYINKKIEEYKKNLD